MKLDRKISELGMALCGDTAITVCGGVLIFEGLHWGTRAAGLICLLGRPRCQEYYTERAKMLDAQIKEREEKAKAASAVGGGIFIPGEDIENPPGIPWGSSSGGSSLDCRLLPAYEISAEGQTWKYDSEVVCKPKGGW